VPREQVAAAFANAAHESQPAWSLLYYALWHNHHVLGVPADGDISEVLHAAARV
jgi:asparagine synthase (glutamine-hydrolysing)